MIASMPWPNSVHDRVSRIELVYYHLTYIVDIAEGGFTTKRSSETENTRRRHRRPIAALASSARDGCGICTRQGVVRTCSMGSVSPRKGRLSGILSHNFSCPDGSPGIFSVTGLRHMKAGEWRGIAVQPALQTEPIRANTAPMIAHTIFIEGHVQGVFFREWTIERAREIGLSGWVRNLADSRVEVYVVGEAACVGRFVDRLRVGSPASQVSQVHVEDAEIERLDGFTRRQSV